MCRARPQQPHSFIGAPSQRTGGAPRRYSAPLRGPGRLTVRVGSVTRPIFFGLVQCAWREFNAAKGISVADIQHVKLQPISATAKPAPCGRTTSPPLFARCERPAAWRCQCYCPSCCLCVGTHALPIFRMTRVRLTRLDCYAQLYGPSTGAADMQDLHELEELRTHYTFAHTTPLNVNLLLVRR